MEMEMEMERRWNGDGAADSELDLQMMLDLKTEWKTNDAWCLSRPGPSRADKVRRERVHYNLYGPNLRQAKAARTRP